MSRRSRFFTTAAFLALAPLVLAFMPIAAGGCAGDAARVHAAAPQLAEMAPDILRDAAIGVSAQADPAIAEGLGVAPISPQLAESKRVHQAEFRSLLDTFTRGGGRTGDGGG